jgi:hypothetical protein
MSKVIENNGPKRSWAVLMTGAVLLGVFLMKPTAYPLDLRHAYMLSDAELARIRGTYAGVYFAFDFSGYWDTAGKANATLDYSGQVGDIAVGGAPPEVGSGSSVTLNSGYQDVRVQAMVGSVSGANGMILISQVPGSNNVVTTVMNVQLTVINVQDAATAARIFDGLTSK